MSTSTGSRPSWWNWGIAFVAIQVLLAGSLVFLHQRAASALPAAPNPDDWDLPVPDMGLTILTGVDRAVPIAQSWREDAELAFVSLQVDWPTSDPPATVTSVSPFGWVRMVFVAPVTGASSDYAALSMLFERVSGALVSTSVSEWNSGLPEHALLEGVTVTDETAILAGELSGGTMFRSACPDVRSQSGISLTVDPATQDRIWNIVYRDSGRSTGNPMRITVNANTGDVREIRAGLSQCTP
jgi:hypothetical protein